MDNNHGNFEVVMSGGLETVVKVVEPEVFAQNYDRYAGRSDL